MRYTLQEQPDGSHSLLHDGEPAYGSHSKSQAIKSEVEFWLEIGRLKERERESDSQFSRIADCICGDARNATGEDKTLAAFATQEFNRLQLAIAKMSHRRCHPCGHEGYYVRDILPFCKCEKCGSEDTRLIKNP